MIELAQRPDLVVAPPSATNGFVVRMLNPDLFRSVTVTVQAVLPEGASYLTNTITPLPWGEPTISMIGNAQSLLWGAVPLAPMAMVTLHWQVIMPPQVGLYTNRVSVTAVQSPTVMRQLVASSSVAVAILPVSGTDVHASAGVLYPPVAPDQPWKIAFSRNATVAPNIVITTTPVCAFPACGPLVRMTALHNGVFYTMTETSAGSKRFTVTIPSHAYDFYEPVYLVPFWENPPTTARTPQAVDFICRMLGLGDIGPDGLIHTDGRCPPPPTIDTPGFFDPSGFVTDAVTGRPVVGATVTLYRVWGTCLTRGRAHASAGLLTPGPAAQVGLGAHSRTPHLIWAYLRNLRSRPRQLIHRSIRSAPMKRGITAGT